MDNNYSVRESNGRRKRTVKFNVGGKIFEVSIELHHLTICKHDENNMGSIKETNKILTD